jgi:GNAT superfamily N-acetyltransferase
MTIERAGAEAIDELEPGWNALREHQGPMLSVLGPAREREASWALRRAKYVRVLADDGFLLVAREHGRAIGYAMVAVARDASHNWAVDAAASVETLCVLPGHRGAGLGSALMDRVREEARAAGLDLLLLGVVAGNEGAERFYARQGFEPAFIEMAQRLR